MWKKISIAILASLVASAPVYAANKSWQRPHRLIIKTEIQQSTYKPVLSRWQVQKYADGKFSSLYWQDGASVYVYRDGRGVNVVMSYSEQNKGTLMQTVDIRQDQGLVRIENTITKTELHGSRQYVERQSRGGVGLFEKYLPIFEELPADVKKLFFGAYGVS